MSEEIKTDSTEVKEDDHAKTTRTTHEQTGKPEVKETKETVEKKD